MIPLPPKRFESVIDPKYDVIRHKAWFGKLDARRAKIPFLKAAKESWDNGKTREAASEMFGVDPRELGDYAAFIDGVKTVADRTHQHILDDAYGHYLGNNAERSFRFYIESIALLYGVNPRHVTEKWEVSHDFYPTGYKR